MKKINLISLMVLIVFCFKQGISQNTQQEFQSYKYKDKEIYIFPFITSDTLNTSQIEIEMRGNVLIEFVQFNRTYEIGTYISFYKSGNIKIVGRYDTLSICKNYPAKDFIDTLFYFNGGGQFAMGNYIYPRVGKWMYFFDNGNIEREEYYKNEFSEECGCVEKKVGVWKYYDSNGRLKKEVNYGE
jgi:antitoxin component YwqK of YwqJK toxin-antitoxin module